MLCSVMHVGSETRGSCQLQGHCRPVTVKWEILVKPRIVKSRIYLEQLLVCLDFVGFHLRNLPKYVAMLLLRCIFF